MRTYIKSKYGPPKVGQTRTINKFAWLPTKIITFDGEIDGVKAINYFWVWLETYREFQIYEEYMRNVSYASLDNDSSYIVKKKDFRWKTLKKQQNL